MDEPLSNHPLVYIVVLNWNSYEDTTACIQSLEASDYKNSKIVIVDNASQDDSEPILRNRFPRYPFIQTGKNWGYGGGNNYGIRHALKEGADYVWIVNPDIVVEKDSLKKLIEVMEKDSSIGISGPRVMWKSRGGIVQSVDGASVFPERGFQIIPNRIHDQGDGEEDHPLEVKEVDVVIGCSMLVRRKVFFDAGLIREDFFMFHEETEFNLRAKNCGWKRVVCPPIKNWHLVQEKGKLKLASYYFPRNNILIARLQNRHRFRTILVCLNIKQNFNLIRKRSFGYLGRQLAGILAGILVPLRPIPVV